MADIVSKGSLPNFRDNHIGRFYHRYCVKYKDFEAAMDPVAYLFGIMVQAVWCAVLFF